MTDADTPTVLIVEDDNQLLELFRDYLEDGYHVRTAASGPDGIDLFDDEVDVVLLDRRMPGTSGDEVLDALRDRGFDGPVTMVTAVEPDTDIVDMAFDDYLVKPVSREDLLRAVRTALDRAEYDASVRSFFALSTKVAMLETEYSRAELEDDAEYRRLVDELAGARAAAGSSLDALAPDEVDRLFREMDAPTFRSSGDHEPPEG